MCKKGEGVVLALPAGIDEGKRNRSITSDKCCVELLKYLWNGRVNTLSHCCGHGEQNPSIVISNGYSEDDITYIQSLIDQVDSREWDILQWRIMKVN